MMKIHGECNSVIVCMRVCVCVRLFCSFMKSFLYVIIIPNGVELLITNNNNNNNTTVLLFYWICQLVLSLKLLQLRLYFVSEIIQM